MIQNASGRSSSSYIAMFAAAKAFAVAQSTLSLNTAIMQAMADPTALTPAQKLANYAAIASAGASLLSNIASTTMSGGRRYGGGVSAGNAYRINEDGRSEVFQTAGGQQMFIPNKSGKVVSADNAGGGSNVTVQQVNHYHFEGSPDSPATLKQFDKIAYNAALRAISNEQRPNGLLRRK
ncbi:hypothetical protein [Atlantibacter hermannii]|nr:hypothetical protein [Atlantibacter hermannii]